MNDRKTDNLRPALQSIQDNLETVNREMEKMQKLVRRVVELVEARKAQAVTS